MTQEVLEREFEGEAFFRRFPLKNVALRES